MSDATLSRKTQQPQQPQQAKALGKYTLDAEDKQIMALKLDHPGITTEDIGKIIGLSRDAISRRINAPKWQAAWEKFHTPAKNMIEEKAGELTRKYLALAKCGNPQVEERVIRTLLISMGIVKNKIDIDADGFEPLIIVQPIAQQVLTVTTKDHQARLVGPGEEKG